ncbi:MAG: metalloprotease [Salinirussus sp.]
MTLAGVRFTRREVLDLAAAWIALSVAFAIFLNPGLAPALLRGGGVDPAIIGAALAAAGLTVGIGFLLHELGHKLLAVHYDQVAVFRANYGMLALAILAALAGWLFAAPGAVHHRGRLTDRQRGLIALAGPATNVGLAIAFLGLAVLPGALSGLGRLGVLVNVFLAGFNMLPVGPLDGRTVLGWSPVVYVAAAAVTIGPAALLLFQFFG